MAKGISIIPIPWRTSCMSEVSDQVAIAIGPVVARNVLGLGAIVGDHALDPVPKPLSRAAIKLPSRCPWVEVLAPIRCAIGDWLVESGVRAGPSAAGRNERFVFGARPLAPARNTLTQSCPPALTAPPSIRFADQNALMALGCLELAQGKETFLQGRLSSLGSLPLDTVDDVFAGDGRQVLMLAYVLLDEGDTLAHFPQELDVLCELA